MRYQEAQLRGIEGGMMKSIRAMLLFLGLTVQPVLAQTVVEYLHTDALGSVVAVTDESGNVIERREYEPYGYQLTPAVQDGPGYTGHVQDAATGLTYMQQRYYDPLCGCFLSVDPVTAFGGDLRHFNRYAYAFNNPYKFVDPDGNKGKVAWLVELGTNQMRKLARLTQEQAVQARRAGQNVVADRRQVASQIETAAHGRDGQLKHAGHELKDGGNGLPHYQTDGVKGHSFWGKLSVGILAAAAGLDQVAEAADVFDPTVSLTSGSGELVNHERTWFGAYKQIDPNGPNFYEADRMRSEGFQGVFRVEGRIDSKRLDDELKGK
ncbi:RHS repeat-associated core domain-containing protein [Pseudoxanthomonas putridarboris]|uniref:RHS repeat-associated core domain-containing protein n=1 Tax=Pseudoxanthomonas putridarboris TaxID=752605 RepID=A0ABU9J0C9_9GAMM